MKSRLRGVIPATYTPLGPQGEVDLDAIRPMVERLLDDGVDGLYVCGSTGEGVSLAMGERKAVAEAFITAVNGRVPVIVHVGHNSLVEACELADHAAASGASATSAMPPTYFRISHARTVVDCCAEMASAAAAIPFYYYHIPAMTGVTIDVVLLLKEVGDRIPNFAGVKYTANTIHEYQECLAFKGGRFDMLFGYDELLLPALAVGARGAVGSTFNIAAPLYRRIIAAFDAGNLAQAREEQLRAIQMIRVLMQRPFHPAMKAVMEMLDTPCGSCRLPLPKLSDSEKRGLRDELQQIGFFTWARPEPELARQ
ncbi:MAG: dihydrodipicolinate synthase family protein [Planctomycetia bacterium]